MHLRLTRERDEAEQPGRGVDLESPVVMKALPLRTIAATLVRRVRPRVGSNSFRCRCECRFSVFEIPKSDELGVVFVAE